MSTITKITSDVNPGEGIRFTDALPFVDFDQLRTHLETLHTGGEGAICLVRFASGDPESRWLHSWSELDANAQPPDDVDRSLWRQCITHGQKQWQFYTALCTFKRPQGVNREGRPLWYRRAEKYAKQVPGVWADLDVKPGLDGHFQTRDELDAFLAKLPPPTMLVDSGSGGCHAYWLLQRHAPAGPAMKNTLRGWHEHLQELAGHVLIDNVQECARILRLAGTVRWAKPDELRAGAAPFSRVVLRYSDGPRYTVNQLAELAGPAYERRAERERAIRDAYLADRERLIAALESEGLQRDNRAFIEQQFNALQDWGVLLERAGWRLVADQRGTGGSSACRYWNRPGHPDPNRGSASTDFENRTTMSLFSAETPQLEQLVDRTLPHGKFPLTTKYRFALVALYDGDEEALVVDIHKNGGTLA